MALEEEGCDFIQKCFTLKLARQRRRASESDAPAHSLARKVGGVGGEGAGEVEGRAAVPTRECPRVKDRSDRLHAGCLFTFQGSGGEIELL